MQTTPLTYLALGDSYTIGEAVGLQENYPYQTVALLRQQGIAVAAPEIVATTGWTTDELVASIREHLFLHQYDFVSLLIGVNNQYRGRPLDEYKKDFAALLQQAIHFAGNKKEHVVVLSIPDYGATPVGQKLQPEKITIELDTFNKAAEEICSKENVVFIDITTASREACNDTTLVASDGLHPAAKEYRKWAVKVAEWVTALLQKSHSFK